MIHLSHCIACGHSITLPLYEGGEHPLSVMHLPQSEIDARNVARFTMDFHACARCGHVFNRAFRYADIPYEGNSNLMFNHGSGWQVYMQDLITKLVESHDLSGKTLLEIGCGDGHFS